MSADTTEAPSILDRVRHHAAARGPEAAATIERLLDTTAAEIRRRIFLDSSTTIQEASEGVRDDLVATGAVSTQEKATVFVAASCELLAEQAAAEVAAIMARVEADDEED